MKHILLVEDESGHAELIRRALPCVPTDCTLTVVSNLAQAEAYLSKNTPTLALVDFRLPDGSGARLVERAAGAFPVVLMTAYGSERGAVEAIKAGALDYIVKSPESFADMPHVVERALREWEHLQERRRADHRLEQINRALLGLGHDFVDNVNRLTALGGELLGARFALYSRIEDETMVGVGRWRVPEGFPDALSKKGSLCEQVVSEDSGGLHFIADFQQSPHAQKSPALRTFGLQAYLGHVVRSEGEATGCLCLFFDRPYEPSENDRRVLGILASGLGVEETRRRAEGRLRESEDRFRRLLEDTPHIAVQGYTPDGRINYWNKASEMVYGYTAEEAMGRDLTELILPPEQRDAFRRDIQQMAATGQPIPAGEFLPLRKDGSRVPVFSSHAVLRGQDGRLQLFCLDMDLTAHKQAEENRLEMERRLLHAQKLESLGVLAGGIAHDFNNLLTAILGNLELAMMDISEVSPARDSLLDARTATRRAADLTRQMLAYSGRGRFQIRSLNLSELVGEMAQLLKVSIGKTATLHLHLAPDLPRIQADVAQIQQVVMNLITNASEALGERVGSITVTTAVQDCTEADLAASRLAERVAPGRYVALVVTDTGCGMDESVQQRLFEPFFTTKFTGRGLGMSAVLGVVRGHRGAICVESAPGAGTTIRVLLCP